jgi:hypothetical protein
MFSYSVKFICGVQNAPTEKQSCSVVRQGAYATEINIHNFNRREEAKIEKRALLLVHNDSPVGREPRFAKPQPFAEITLPPDTATMDDCCGFAEKLKLTPGHITIGFLEIVSNVELNVVAVYTATDLKAVGISIEVETIQARQI